MLQRHPLLIFGKYMEGFFQAIADYQRAFQLVSQHALGVFFVIPALISLLIGALLIFLIVAMGDHLGLWFASLYPFESGNVWAGRVGQVLAYILLALAGIFLFKYIVIIVLSPVLSPLSQRVEKLLRQPEHDSNWSVRQIVYEGVSSLQINLRNILRELLYTILLLLIGLIPGAGIFTGPLIIGVQSFYAGFGNMDFTLERHCTVGESVRFVRANRGYAIGNGVVFIFMLM